MYNAPMQKGKWKNIRRYESEGNRTKGSAEMVNYELPLEDYATIQAENRKNRDWELEHQRKQRILEMYCEKKRKELGLDNERERQDGLGSS